MLHVDETPVRAAGGLAYVHVASTEFLTAMHTGGRSKDDIDAGQVLPGYTGTIVRDGYAGYQHLIDAHHAWCGAHLLRDLAAFHRADPDGQFWAAAMADLLTDAHHRAHAARAAGHDSLAPDVLTDIRRRYRGATAAGISDNTTRAGAAMPSIMWPGILKLARSRRRRPAWRRGWWRDLAAADHSEGRAALSPVERCSPRSVSCRSAAPMR